MTIVMQHQKAGSVLYTNARYVFNLKIKAYETHRV